MARRWARVWRLSGRRSQASLDCSDRHLSGVFGREGDIQRSNRRFGAIGALASRCAAQRRICQSPDNYPLQNGFRRTAGIPLAARLIRRAMLRCLRVPCASRPWRMKGRPQGAPMFCTGSIWHAQRDELALRGFVGVLMRNHMRRRDEKGRQAQAGDLGRLSSPYVRTKRQANWATNRSASS